ncbi:DUF2628 domain-containing protein [Ancylobacter sp. WKF20]|uniref:DUF2628 domain-containing protein n=1 Tax=Ancylobacter sp. WKF20 TaxID=3039801 RepID=UPI00243466AE|nr:DUF2628 domain-containing protein [Ancylobacter sp. WKF20]WGD29285.1 DUF2628 domain-containing protein [Ancylobacter sp. WKF20]
MAVWTVFEPEELEEARTGDWAEAVVFVPERFAWSALLLAPLVLLRHGLWLALIGYVAIQAALGAALHVLDVDDGLALLIIVNLAVAVLLPGLRRAKLLRTGHEEVGAVVAPNFEAAEQRYFAARMGSASTLSATFLPRRTDPPSRADRAPILGLFPEASR